MTSAPVTSSGTPSFDATAGGARRGSSSGKDNATSSSDDSPSSSRISIKSRVQERKQLQLQKQGKKLVNLKMFSNDLRIQNAASNEGNSEKGMKAVMITRDKQNPSDFQVQILRVRPDGSTTTLFRSDVPGPAGLQSSAGDLNLRGSMMDTRI